MLEIGCGSGAAARAVAQRIGKGHVLGIDRSAKAIAQATASSKAELDSGRLSFSQVAIEDFLLKRGEKRYDIAFAVRVGTLDGRHAESERAALDRVARALVKGVRLFIDGGTTGYCDASATKLLIHICETAVIAFNIEDIHQAAVEIARLGGEHTLNYYQQNLEIERKHDQSPVTVADREVESLMRKEIQARFPDHGIVGEEHGKHNPEAPVLWILDPIDGTQSFIHGMPLYTTLIGIVHNNEPVSGVIFAPVLDELCEAAKGKGARLNGATCEVRPCDLLRNATFLSTDVTTAADFGLDAALQKLLHKTKLHRTWGDAYGHMMVATGRADLMFDPVLNIWDAAPLLPIMREAGGIFCDVTGRETIQTGNGISCSRELVDEVLEQFR